MVIKLNSVLVQTRWVFAKTVVNCTDRLQPLDVSVNKSVKEFLCQKFHSWYAESVSTQLIGTKAKEPVDLCLEHGTSGETAILSPSVFVVSLTGRKP